MMRSERGSVLMLVIIFSFIMAATGVAAIYLCGAEEVAAYNYYISAKASAQAKAGFEKAISFIATCRDDNKFVEEVAPTPYSGYQSAEEYYYNIKGNFGSGAWEYLTSSNREKYLPHVEQLPRNDGSPIPPDSGPAHLDDTWKWPDDGFVHLGTSITVRRYLITGYGVWGDVEITTERGEKRLVQGVVRMTRYYHPLLPSDGKMHAAYEPNSIIEIQRNIKQVGTIDWSYYSGL